jgi:GPH family glycoside/pentoside/hexuronide:cation symporter
MFGTSIPINMLKTYAAIFYVDKLGLTTVQFALILSIYTFIDALDNPVYGFLSDRTRTRWGRRRPWLVIGTILLVLFFVGFYSPPAGLAANMLFGYCMLFYILTGSLDSVINANYGALFPELFAPMPSAPHQCPAPGLPAVAMIISIALTPWSPAPGLPDDASCTACWAARSSSYMALTSHEVRIDEADQKPQLWDSIKPAGQPQVLDRRLCRCFYSRHVAGAGLHALLRQIPLAIPDSRLPSCLPPCC